MFPDYDVIYSHFAYTSPTHVHPLQEFLNEEDDYEGPELLVSTTTTTTTTATFTNATAATTSATPPAAAALVPVLRAVLVQEYEVKHQEFAFSALPKSVNDLMTQLQ